MVEPCESTKGCRNASRRSRHKRYMVGGNTADVSWMPSYGFCLSAVGICGSVKTAIVSERFVSNGYSAPMYGPAISLKAYLSRASSSAMVSCI